MNLTPKQQVIWISKIAKFLGIFMMITAFFAFFMPYVMYDSVNSSSPDELGGLFTSVENFIFNYISYYAVVHLILGAVLYFAATQLEKMKKWAMYVIESYLWILAISAIVLGIMFGLLPYGSGAPIWFLTIWMFFLAFIIGIQLLIIRYALIFIRKKELRKLLK